VVADTLSQYVDKTWDNPMFYSSVTCLIAAVFFAFQSSRESGGLRRLKHGCAASLTST